MVRALAFLASIATVWAQGTEPKAKAADYDVHDRVKSVEVGAEYMVTSVAGPGGMYVVPDHLVVEVALFPPKGDAVTASPGDFQLRVDGKTLRPVTAQMVVAAIQRSEWRYPRGPQASVGMGNDTVTLGGPTQQVPPYGGPTRRTPTPPRAPAPEDRSGLPKPEPVKVTELVVTAALPDGAFKGPVSGFVYFPYTGKASKVRTVTLLYGDASLKLK